MRAGKLGPRHQQILDAARTLIAEKGFDGCRMDEVAAAVGVTKPAIYRYFPGKDHLIHALLEEDLLHPSQALFADIDAFDGPLRGLLEMLAERSLQIQDRGRSRGYMLLAIDEAERRPQIATLIREEVLGAGLIVIGKAFSRAVARGELRANEDVSMMLRLFYAPFMQLSLIRGGMGVPMNGLEEQRRYLRMHVDAFLRAFGTAPRD